MLYNDKQGEYFLLINQEVAMKKIIFGALIISILTSITLVYADPSTTAPSCTPINWQSMDNNHPFTIQNGAGISITITITVDHQPLDNTLANVNVKNCGTVVSIVPGSTAVCSTTDAINPVTLTSDSGTKAVSGTYTIKAN